MNTEGMGSAGVSPAVFGVPPNTSSPVRPVKLGQGECNGLISRRPVRLNRTASQSVAVIFSGCGFSPCLEVYANTLK